MVLMLSTAQVRRLSACLRRLEAVNGSTRPPFDELDVDELLARLHLSMLNLEAAARAQGQGGQRGRIQRPVRHGKFFVLHSSYLLEIEHLEKCDIHAEFLRDHPNGGERTAGLVAVRLSDEQIDKLRGRLRITSYRWDLMRGVGEGGKEGVIPGNYFGFLEHIREHKLIIWMDWMANVGVNVPVPETIGYMGLLYAECVVLGDWMLDVDKLGTALSRAWIYQEMSFGALDEAAMGGLFEELRARGRAV